MKNRINKTGNNKGDQIIVVESINYDGDQINYEGTYIDIDDKGYVELLVNDGTKRWVHYKKCYKKSCRVVDFL